MLAAPGVFTSPYCPNPAAPLTSRPLKTIVVSMTQTIPVDAHIIDALMRDLVGHDRSPAAFIVYLWLWRRSADSPSVGVSLQSMAHATGLSKSAVQAAVRRLTARQLIAAQRLGPTLAPSYRVLAPWRG